VNFDFRRYWFTLVLLIVIAAMGLELIYLIAQNRRLRGIISSFEGNYKILSQEDFVPQFTARDLSDNVVRVEYSPDQPYTLLMWFSAACSACEDNLQFWNDLYRGYNSSGLRFMGVCTDAANQAKNMVADYSLIFPVVYLDDEAILDAYAGYTLPQTMLISPQGAVLKVWRGSLKQENKESITGALAHLGSLTMEEGDI